MENILVTKASDDYELLDSGNGEKLERYGLYVLARPDPQAIWPKSLSEIEWKKANAKYVRTSTSGKWLNGQSPSPDQGDSFGIGEMSTEVPATWNIKLEGLTLSLKLLPSKHLGIFPEQSAQWKWLESKILERLVSGKEVNVLNLFGYTGGATLACAKAGASVCHIDGSQFPVDKLKENMELSGLQDKPIRLIVEDVRKFVEREIKRGNKYDVVLLDPPVYGKGSNGEVWNIEEDLMLLLKKIKNILSVEPLAIVLNGYASIYSPITYKQMLNEVTHDLGGMIESGEVTIEENSGRLLSSGIFARWSK